MMVVAVRSRSVVYKGSSYDLGDDCGVYLVGVCERVIAGGCCRDAVRLKERGSLVITGGAQ